MKSRALVGANGGGRRCTVEPLPGSVQAKCAEDVMAVTHADSLEIGEGRKIDTESAIIHALEPPLGMTVLLVQLGTAGA